MEESRVSEALSITRTPANPGQVEPLGPEIVNHFMLTFASLNISTIFTLPGKGNKGLGFRTAGASIVVDLAPEPIIVRLLDMTSCSVYVPARTLIVSPPLAASIAFCMVGKSVGTVIVAAFAIGKGDNGMTIRRNIAANIGRHRIFFNLARA